MFDGDTFGAEMVQIVREFVASELDPLRAENKALAEANALLVERLEALEARELPSPEKGDPGAPGEPGRDGADCDMEVVKTLIAEQVRAAVAELPAPENGAPGRDGRDADMEAIDAAIDAKVKEAVAAIPPAKDGRDGKDIERIAVEQDGRDVTFSFEVGDTEFRATVELPEAPPGPQGEPGREGAPGKLELARAWTDEVHYEGSVRTHNGGAWQALRDTAKEPPHADWICLASRGADGRDGAGFNLRGLWSAESEYKHLDVVALNGASFAAKRDNPGPCPGEGWQLFAQQGKRGQPGEKGAPGQRGEPGMPVIAAAIDENGMQTLVNGDGTQVECDLYPVLSKLVR